jgi:hypothetical protein
MGLWLERESAWLQVPGPGLDPSTRWTDGAGGAGEVTR